MKRIGVFGGTFNPPHVAHYRLALEAVRECALDEVIIIRQCNCLITETY